MNLIMSDVEETIMIVDGLEENTAANASVRVREVPRLLILATNLIYAPDGETENGNALRARGLCSSDIATADLNRSSLNMRKRHTVGRHGDYGRYLGRLGHG